MSKLSRREEGDRRARSKIYDEFMNCRGYLAMVVGRILRRSDVEDVVQETFLRVFEASARQQIRHPRAFLIKTARNLALNSVAKMSNRDAIKVHVSDSSSACLESSSAECAVELEERLILFCRAVQKMPGQARRAFVLKKVYGLNRREIAVEMGLSECTVKKHIAKGMIMCEDYLRRMAMRPNGSADEARDASSSHAASTRQRG